MLQNQKLRADLLLALAALIWGFAFVAQRLGMEHVGPFTFNAIRFFLGALAISPLLMRDVRRLSREELRMTFKPILFIGAALFTAISLQQSGIVYTTAGKSGFLTSLYVIVVAFLVVFSGQRLARTAWLAGFIAVCGSYLLCISKDLAFNIGDGLTLIATIFFALQVVLADRYVKQFPVALIACGQFFVVGLLSLPFALAFESLTMDQLVAVTWPLLYGSFFSISGAYFLQMIAQQHAPPVHAVIILNFEAVFAVLGGWLIIGEILTPRMLAGCALILLAVFVSQYDTLRKNLGYV